MLGRKWMSAFFLVAAVIVISALGTDEAQAGGKGQPTDWNRFYYYPYVYYPHNFSNNQQSFDHMYYRYPPQRQIPVYNTSWHNFYPAARPYHSGHHFLLDIF